MESRPHHYQHHYSNGPVLLGTDGDAGEKRGSVHDKKHTLM